MAPIARKTQTGIVRNAHRKSQQTTSSSTITKRAAASSSHRANIPSKETSSSWELVRRDDDDEDDDDEEEEDDAANDAPPFALQNGGGLSNIINNNSNSNANISALDSAFHHPLREMADRVGRNVESFAEALDKFSTDLSSITTSSNNNNNSSADADAEAEIATARFVAAQQLVSNFGALAAETVTALRKSVERERAAELRREWVSRARIEGGALSAAAKALTTTTNSSVSAGSILSGAGSASQQQQQQQGSLGTKAEQVALLRCWQQEVDLWELFRIVLETHAAGPVKQRMREEREEKLSRLPPPHPYSSERELWRRFTLEDDLARERQLIKRWLEETAENQDSDLSSIVDELEMQAGRGKGGLWSSGWLHTRERIKAEKRLRSWPNAADSPLPQIRRSDGNELLATTLDPDAPLRQGRGLEKPDGFFERALWVVCWEMLRRGKSAREVDEWCGQRKEGWRAMSLGLTQDDEEEPAASKEAWRRMCRVASESGCSSDYEAAVYGLLGGNVRAVLRVCHSFDDHLYAYYSTMLLRQFDDYVLRVCPAKATRHSSHSRTQTGETDENAEQAVVDLLIRLRKGTATKSEASQPLKTIQGYLLGNMTSTLITTVGAMIGLTASSLHGNETQDLIEPAPPGVADSQPETVVAFDPQALRIVTHMAIVLRVTHPQQHQGQQETLDLDLEENVLVAYMQALRAAGKRDLIPLYASQLQPTRYVKALGRMLQDIAQPREQREMLSLLKSFSLDVVAILDANLKWTVRSALMPGSGGGKAGLEMLETVDETKLWPGQRIRLGFCPDELQPGDEDVLNCLQWFMLLPGHWSTAFAALSTMLRKCLVAGRFACARAIVERFPYEEVAAQKSHETIGRTINPMDEQASAAAFAAAEHEDERMLWSLLRRQSQTYHDLEQLVRAVEALADWRAEEHKYVIKQPKPSAVPGVVKRAKENVSLALQPFLGTAAAASPPSSSSSRFKAGGPAAKLLHPVTFTDGSSSSSSTSNEEAEEEKRDLALIRRAYLPDLLLAYNVVLHAAGNLITRDSLLESMDLAAVVADNSNGNVDGHGNGNGNGSGSGVLLDALREAGRVRELVAMFALTSKAMLVLKAEGKAWRKKRDREGRELGLWEIGGRELGDEVGVE